MLAAVDEVDIGAIVRAQVEKAKKGDSAAAKTVFALVAAASRLERPPSGGRVREFLRALGPEATLAQVRKHLAEDGEVCSEEEYRAEWQQMFGGRDERGRPLRPPAIGKGGED